MSEAQFIGKRLLFLDIDGVLLRRRHAGDFDAFELAPGCLEFLEWATSRFECRWLSMRCRKGWSDGSRRAFRLAGAPVDDDPHWSVLNLIEPAVWSVNKTEAIDPESDFWWVDDDVSGPDREWLRLHNREDRLVIVSKMLDPHNLHIPSLRTSKSMRN